MLLKPSNGQRYGCVAKGISDRVCQVYHEKSADDRQNIERILRGTLLFRDLAQEHLTAVVDAMERREFNAGDQPITQGDEGDVFYVVQSGDFTFIKDGKEVGKVGANGSFGELALMYSQPRAATVWGGGIIL